MSQLTISWEPERRIFSVSELSAAIRGLFEDQFSDIWVSGEISGTKTASSGHCYFSLKDDGAQVRCVCFRGTARYLKFKPQDGIAVLARGRLDVYESRGEYQLLVEALEPQGYGALQLAFEQLKKKLAAEGLFDAARKRALPKYPARIGIVSSPAGAVIQDILQILSRRFPGIHIRLYPALVQGEGAAAAISRGIGYFSRSGWPQVVIVARGGGSLEDLWAFNEESVARAIAACSVPVISAIGHETDFTIADFVADLRAPTPSAAAEIVICTRQELLDGISACARKMEQALRYRLAAAGRRLHEQGVDRATTVLHRRIGRFSQRVDELEYALRDRLRNALLRRGTALSGLEQRLRRMDLRLRFAAAHRRLAFAHAEAIQAMRFRLTAARGRFEPLNAQLAQLSPLRVLDRGYAIVLDERGEILKDAAQTSPGAQLEIRLSRGRVGARVTERK